MGFFTNLYNRIFKSNKNFIVWTAASEYNILWSDANHAYGTFFYQIVYYPYKINKYKIAFHPEYIEHWPKPKRHATEHHYYGKVLEKLAEFQQEELLNIIKLPEIEGISKSI